MEVTLTTAPLAVCNSFNNPRASMMGAKKLIWNTVFQSSSAVSREFMRAPPVKFGADGGIVHKGIKLGRHAP